MCMCTPLSHSLQDEKGTTHTLRWRSTHTDKHESVWMRGFGVYCNGTVCACVVCFRERRGGRRCVWSAPVSCWTAISLMQCTPPSSPSRLRGAQTPDRTATLSPSPGHPASGSLPPEGKRFAKLLPVLQKINKISTLNDLHMNLFNDHRSLSGTK